MSIILAAMAPVMTTRSKADSSSPWRYSPENLSDAYFGPGESQVAMIGQPNKLETDDAARLIINTSSSLPVHLSFKRDNATVGRLQFPENNLILGNSSMEHLTDGSNNISIGRNNLTQVTSGDSNISIGNDSLLQISNGNGNISLGSNSLSNNTGSYNVAIGYEANKDAEGSNNAIAIGAKTIAKGKSAISIGGGNVDTIATGDNAIAIGYYAVAISDATLALGPGARATGPNAMAIGTVPLPTPYEVASASGSSSLAIGNAIATEKFSMAIATAGGGTGSVSTTEATGETSIAIGVHAFAEGKGSLAIQSGTQALDEFSIAIGSCASSEKAYAIALGYDATASGDSSIAIGGHKRKYDDEGGTSSSGQSSIAIGYDSISGGQDSISLGTSAIAKGQNNIAIGANACKYATGSNKVCIGANSGPSSGDKHSNDAQNIIYLGDSNTTVVLHHLVVHGEAAFDGNIYASLERKGYRKLYFHGMDDDPVYNGHFGSNDPSREFNWYVSDKRLKYLGKEFISGLDKIKKLKVFNYTFKQDETKTPHVGVIAQDLQKVFPDAVKKGTDGFLTIRFEDMFFAMINAIKELDLKYQAQEKRINELEARIERLEDKILY